MESLAKAGKIRQNYEVINKDADDGHENCHGKSYSGKHGIHLCGAHLLGIYDRQEETEQI
jgi:hypothetical protein